MIDLAQFLGRCGLFRGFDAARLTALVRTAQEIRLELPLVFAGHETTGHTLSWALWEMVARPELEARVLAEVMRFRQTHAGRALTTTDYDERPVSWALLAESLRRHSPVEAVPRTTQREGVVPPDPETGIGGFHYPAGAMVVFSTLGVHLDPGRWLEPRAFRPERWLEGIDERLSAREQGRLVRAAIRAREQALDWMPFSDGPGRCPGQHFNAHEFLVVLDALLPRYRFEPADPARVVRHGEALIVGPEPGTMAVRIRWRAPARA